MQQRTTTGGQKLVAIGGGTGLSTLLAGLKRLVGKTDEPIWIESLSAIVTVSDDGGSSGRLRDELQMLPPQRHRGRRGCTEKRADQQPFKV